MMTDFEKRILTAFAQMADPVHGTELAAAAIAAEDPAWGTSVASETAEMRLLASALVLCRRDDSIPTVTIEDAIKAWSDLDARTLFGGLLLYAAANPDGLTYGGQTDKALHYIAGGWAEVMAGLGDEAGKLKEVWDAARGRPYDHADEQATKDGAAEARRRAAP
jgi:hypothetical protein